MPEYKVKLPPLLKPALVPVNSGLGIRYVRYEKQAVSVYSLRLDFPEKRYNPEPETELQRAYLRRLEAFRRLNRELPDNAGNEPPYITHAVGYSLYDIDKDGTVELLVMSGEYGMGRYVQVYTFRDGREVYLGLIYHGNGCLHTWPGKNALLYTYGHSGLYSATEFYIEDGAIESRLIFRGEFADASQYPDSGDIARSSRQLVWYQIELDLPLMSLGAEEGSVPAKRDDLLRERLMGAVRGNEPVYGADGGFLNGGEILPNPFARTGLTSFGSYCAGLDDGYPCSVSSLLWADLNGDGQEECVLWDGWKYCLVLSLQDDTVYAYCIYVGFGRLTVYGGGTLLIEQDYDGYDGETYTSRCAFRVFFDRDECFSAGTDAESLRSAEAIDWQPFSVSGAPEGED